MAWQMSNAKIQFLSVQVGRWYPGHGLTFIAVTPAEGPAVPFSRFLTFTSPFSHQRELLTRIRRDALRDAFEARHAGGFSRIFPVTDPARRDRYAAVLQHAFSTFLSSRAPALHDELNRTYKDTYKVRDTTCACVPV